MPKFTISCTVNFTRTYDASDFKDALNCYYHDYSAPRDFDPTTFKIQEERLPILGWGTTAKQDPIPVPHTMIHEELE